MSSEDLSLRGYLDKLARPSALWGGGSAASYTAAMGWALLEMLLGLEQKAHPDGSLNHLLQEAAHTRLELWRLTHEDTRAFRNLLKHVSQDTYDEATRVPLTVFQHSQRGLELLRQNLFDDLTQAQPDRDTASSLFRTAIQSSRIIIEANLPGVSASLKQQATDLLSTSGCAVKD